MASVYENKKNLSVMELFFFLCEVLYSLYCMSVTRINLYESPFKISKKKRKETRNNHQF